MRSLNPAIYNKVVKYPMHTMTYEEDFVDANAGAIVDGTWYEITNYSGAGLLFSLGFLFENTALTAEFRITTDGGTTHTVVKGTVNYLEQIFRHGAANSCGLATHIEFQNTLLIEVRRDGDTNDIDVLTQYSIMSEEFKREIILAGDPVPDRHGNPRPKTYSHDIMLVWFRGKSGISNKVQFPEPEVSLIDLTEEKLFDSSYNDTVGANRYSRVQSSFTGTKSVIVDGINYDVDIVNGVIQLSTIPYHITNVELWERFTTAEQEALIDHINVKVQTLLHELKTRSLINLRWAKLITAINALETAGIIGVGRAAEILAIP
jgi:hypothetical protein